jgi:hypothetical protein
MKSAVPNTDDEIEVIAEKSGPWGRIRIREKQGASFADHVKCSIFLTPDQLEEHARECLVLAAKIRNSQVEFELIPARSVETPEAARAGYLGMTIEQYRRAFHRK